MENFFSCPRIWTHVSNISSTIWSTWPNRIWKWCWRPHFRSTTSCPKWKRCFTGWQTSSLCDYIYLVFSSSIWYLKKPHGPLRQIQWDNRGTYPLCTKSFSRYISRVRTGQLTNKFGTVLFVFKNKQLSTDSNFFGGQSRPLFVYFCFVFKHQFTEKIVGFNVIRTWFVGVEGKHADYLTTTKRPNWFELNQNTLS